MRNLKIYAAIKIIIIVVFLVTIDQIAKIIIDRYFLDSEINIIKGIIAFKPHLNTHYSWINSLFKLNVGLIPHLIIVIVTLPLAIIAYSFIKNNKCRALIIDFMFINLIAGIICSFFDKVFWGGSLDFVWLKGFFIFDIKDVYISIFEVTAVIMLIKNNKKINNFHIKEVYDYVIQKSNYYKLQNK